MNGRFYDPLLGMFISLDNFVQAPDLAQSYNRYAYCMFNPLNNIDPTGFSWLSRFGDWLGSVGKTVTTIAVGIVVTVAVAAVIVASCGAAAAVGAVFLGGMAGGFAGGATGAALNGGDFIDCMFAGMTGMMIAAVTQGVMAGVGNLQPQWLQGKVISSGTGNGVWSLGNKTLGNYFNSLLSGPGGSTLINGVGNGLLAGAAVSAAGSSMLAASMNNYSQTLLAYDTPASSNSASDAITAVDNSISASSSKPIIPGIYNNSLENIGYQLRNVDRSLDGFYNGGQAPKAMQFIANQNPIISVTNGVKTMATGSDIYGQRVAHRYLNGIWNIYGGKSMWNAGSAPVKDFIKGQVYDQVVPLIINKIP